MRGIQKAAMPRQNLPATRIPAQITVPCGMTPFWGIFGSAILPWHAGEKIVPFFHCMHT
jgi:hypothetical protein